MNGGLAFNAVLTLLLDDRSPVTGLMLLDDGRSVAIAVPVVVPVALAHGYAGADRPGANADLVRHRGHRKRAHRCGNKQILLHDVLLPNCTGRKRLLLPRVPTEPAQTKG